MENNNACQKCGAEMTVERCGCAVTYTCPKCGWSVATTEWEPIDLDDTIFTVSLAPGNPANKEMLSLVSRLTGKNFIESKKVIESNGAIFSGKAREIQNFLKDLEGKPIKVQVSPDFPY